jgi:DUF4097 and DUF4098 domain-containing protein YvlB
MSRSAYLAAAFLALAPLSSAAGAQQSDDQWLRDCQERSDRSRLIRHCDVRVTQMAAPAGPIRVDPGENGGVAIEGWTGSGVEIHARIETRAESEAEARALAETVRVLPGETITTAGPESRRDATWHVSFVVYVPADADLELSTSNGPLSVRGVTSRMTLETRNGPLALREVGGDVYARTQNGPLSVSLTGNAWRGAGLDAETRNGPVTLSLPVGFNAELEVGTRNGPFASDIPLAVPLRGRMRAPITATLGTGGAPIRAVTSNGPLSIRSSGGGGGRN